MKKDPSLSCKASGRALLPGLLRNWRPNAAYSTPMTNSLAVSTTGHRPRIYFFQYRAIVTGWQLTADRIFLQQGDLRGWHQLAGVVLIRLGAVVCGCTFGRSSGSGSGLLKQIRSGIIHCAYNNSRTTNINNGDNGSSIIQAFPWSGFFLLYFTLGCPVTLQYFQTFV